MSQIALVGAAGAIGQSIAAALNQEDRPYRVVGRNRGALESAFGQAKNAQIAAWDPSDSTSARAALQGIRTLIYLVGVPYDQFQLHPVVMRQTLDAAIAEGVEKIVLIGTVYPYGLPQTTPLTEAHPREPNTFKGKMRKAQEDLLLEADAAGKIRGTVLRLPDFYGPGVEKSFLQSLFHAAANGGTANMLGPIDTPHEFVYVPDVGPVVLALAARDEAYGRWWHLGGSVIMTQREIIERVFRMAGRKPRFRVAGKRTLQFLGLFNPLMRELAEMNYLLTNPVILDDTALYGVLGKIHKTPNDEGFRASLEAACAIAEPDRQRQTSTRRQTLPPGTTTCRPSLPHPAHRAAGNNGPGWAPTMRPRTPSFRNPAAAYSLPRAADCALCFLERRGPRERIDFSAHAHRLADCAPRYPSPESAHAFFAQRRQPLPHVVMKRCGTRAVNTELHDPEYRPFG